MRIRLTLAALGFAVGGCVSTTDPMLEAPTQVVYSERNPDDIDYCLANAYAAVHQVARQKREDGSTRLVFRNAATGWVRFAVRIWPNDQGSRVEFWKGQDGISWVEGCL